MAYLPFPALGKTQKHGVFKMADPIIEPNIIDRQTTGAQAASLINDTKRLSNELNQEVSGLSEVARTGDYSDLNDAPSIGTAAALDFGFESDQIPTNSGLRVDTIDSLRSLEPAIANQQVGLLRRSSTGLGGGVFWYDSTDTDSIDDGIDTIVTSGGARWKRLLPGVMANSKNITTQDRLFIFCGDSTTEQAGGNGFGFDSLTTNERGTTGRLNNIRGTVNFGGSGHQFKDFVNGALGTLPIVNSSENLGVGNWDYFGHKPTGATSLETALAWREGKSDSVTWVLCFGINDCILDASVGNLPQVEIESLINGYLKIATDKISYAFPSDSIILRTPNPMTARPYDPLSGFPSPTAYPTFGDVLETDQALVEKWNLALNNAYILGQYRSTLLWDTWGTTFGPSNVTVPATNQAFLGDLVHPSGSGYSSMLTAFTEVVRTIDPINNNQLQERARIQGASLSINPWEVDPNYCEENSAFAKVSNYIPVVGIGPNFFDLSISLTDATVLFGNLNSIILNLNGFVAQEFTGFTIGAVAANTRFLSVAPVSEMQGERGFVKVYTELADSGSGDPYIDGLRDSDYRFIFTGNVGASGNGFIDFTLDPLPGRISSTYASATIPAGRLAIGNGNDQIIDLSTATASMSGVASQRSFRILLAGDHSALANSTAAIAYDNAARNPYSLDTA